MVFISDGVVIRSVELYDLVKTTFWFRLPSLTIWKRSENEVVGVTNRSGRTKPITKRENVNCDCFIVPLLLPTQTVWFSLDRKRQSQKWNWKKMITFWFFRLRFRRCCDSTFMIPTPTPSNSTWIGLLLTPRDVPTFSVVVVIKVKKLFWLLSRRKTTSLKVVAILLPTVLSRTTITQMIVNCEVMTEMLLEPITCPTWNV